MNQVITGSDFEQDHFFETCETPFSATGPIRSPLTELSAPLLRTLTAQVMDTQRLIRNGFVSYIHDDYCESIPAAERVPLPAW